ncbi:hypothetical protein CBS470a_005640 [Colletotrichum nupharicola]|nr:hypothetical protein CBS470a_005640 [Colletotrichum nupharicola]
MSIHDTSSPQVQEPKQPQFVGPTRSAFSLKVAETSLTRMGISAQTPLPSGVCESLAPTRYPTPEQSEPALSVPGTDVLLTMPLDEVVRLLEVFQEEVETVYPFLDTGELVSKAAEIRCFIEDSPDRPATAGPPAVDIKDVILAKVAIATSIVVEAHGKNHASNKLVEPLKHLIYQLSIDAQADLKVIQIMTMISIYYFFSDEELLAWRNIGIAARAALEMGLHQNLSIVENFPDERERGLAVHTVAFLDFTAQNWSNSIPDDLQLRHPLHRGTAGTQPPRALRRLQALLYLRGNHIRTLIHRHHVINSASIEADPQKARLVVDIAIDSISVLVHLSETSDIYMRQQSAFNYFLLSAVAVLFLA